MGKCKFVFFPHKVGRFFSPPSYAIRDLVVFIDRPGEGPAAALTAIFALPVKTSPPLFSAQ